MKFSQMKVALGLRVAGTAMALLAAYGGMQPLLVEPAQAASAIGKPVVALTAEASRQEASVASTYSGIGATVGLKDGRPVVVMPYAGLPAYLAGVKAGDMIMKVDGQDVTTLPLSEIVNRVRGDEGVAVTLTIFRPSTQETLEISIVRAEIDTQAMTYACSAGPIRGFGTVWQQRPEVRRWLGCPFTDFRQDEHATRAAVQTFEHGWMLWLETDTVANVDPIYVFFEDDGSYIRYGDRELTDAHRYAPTPAGFYKVGDRFAKVYWEELGPEGRTRLGLATNEARDSQGAFQEFQNGRMFWAGESDTIYVIYEGAYDPDGDGQVTQMRGWLSYEDTFEDTKS